MPEACIPQSTEQIPSRAPLSLAKLLQSVLFMVAWLSMLFVAAGTLLWTRGRIFVCVYAVSMAVIGLVVEHCNPGLMAARSKWRHKDTKGFDRIFLAVHYALITVLPAVAGLDAIRFRRSSMPPWTVPLSVALFLLASALIAWTLAVNPWAEFSVRIQTDRGQRTVSSAPYRYVRHPMYLSSMAGMLGSMWCLALTGAIASLFIWRTIREDSTLRQELAGYEAAWDTRKADSRLTLMAVSNCAASSFSSEVTFPTPALLMTQSRRPNCSNVRPMRVSTSPGTLTSAWTAMARAPE